MTVLQTVNLSADAVKMRWKEPYVTAGINQKNIASHPKGVLAGFNVVPSAGFVVSVQIDPTLNLSVANVLETTGGYYSVTVVQPTNILIDLTAQANTTVYVVVDAQYTVGAVSAAQVRVVDALTDADWVLLAKVNVPAVGPITTAHINSGYRNSAGDSESAELHNHFNLVNNPTFEATTSGWVNSGFLTLTATSYTSKAGSYSLRANLIVAGLASATSGPMPVVAGRSYRTAAWMRSTTAAVPTGSDGPVAGGNGAKLQVGFYDAAGAQIGSWTDIEAAFTGAGTTWVERKSEVIAPALALTAKLRIHFDNCNGTLYVDEVEFASHLHDEVMKSAVFGGDTLADAWHKHTGAGLTYAGSPAFADGSTLTGPTLEDGLDQVATNLGGGAGAAKIGFTATTPKDLTVARVDLALDELDDKKAGLALANIFTKNNTITNTVVDTAALTATGNGTGAGVIATGGATLGAVGVEGTGGTAGGSGVKGSGTLAGSGVYGKGGATLGAVGVEGEGGTAGGSGVKGSGTLAGSGVYGKGGATGRGGFFEAGNTSGAGIRSVGSTGGAGSGVEGIGGNHAGPDTAIGVYGEATAGNNSGVYGKGFGTGAGVTGGGSTVGGSAGGTFYGTLAYMGVRGEGGATAGAVGVAGQGGSAGGHGVNGVGVLTGAGVRGEGGATAPSSNVTLDHGAGIVGVGGSGGGSGVYAQSGNAANIGTLSTTNKAGVVGVGTGPFGCGVIGISAAHSSTGSFGVQGVGSDGFDTHGVYGAGKGQGNGAFFSGAGTGTGAKAYGGATAPVSSVTLPDGAGVVAYGGSGGGSGVYAQSGNATNIGVTSLALKAGVVGIGTGTFGVGVIGLSSAHSSTGSFGGSFSGSDGFDTNGVAGLGKGAGHGGVFTGGTTGNAIRVSTGHAAFIGANPGITTGFSNTLTPKNICKAWGSYLANAAGSPAGSTGTIQNGFNIEKIEHTATEIRVFFQTDVTAGYTVVVTMGDAVNLFACVPNAAKGTASFDIVLVTTANTVASPVNWYVQFVVYAQQ